MTLSGWHAITLLGLTALPVLAQDPQTTDNFSKVVTSQSSGFTQVANYAFGTNADRTVGAGQFGSIFVPYVNVNGTTGWNHTGQWQRFNTFDSNCSTAGCLANFVFTPTTLDLTAYIPQGYGLYNGGILSGQLATMASYQPGVTGYSIYAFEVRMKTPKGVGMWPAVWFYRSNADAPGDCSEIDNPEFFNTAGNPPGEQYWTGFTHGLAVDGCGSGPYVSPFYSLADSNGLWNANHLDFSDDYHNYQTVWTTDAVYKYVDGTLVRADSFTWTAKQNDGVTPNPAQFMVSMQVGLDSYSCGTCMQPNDPNEFPAALSIQHIKIWGK